MKQVMNWLKSGKHRLIAAVGVTLLLVTCASLAEVVEHNLLDVQQAGYIRFGDSNRSGELICMTTGESDDTRAMPKGWITVTCNDLNTPISWHQCYINPQKQSFICGGKPT